MDPVVITIGAVSIVVLLYVWTPRKKSTRLPLPPGPRRIPFLGNIFDIDINQRHISYTKWGHQYGDIVYSRLFGRDCIIVNSEKAARALSDARRSVVYADRPKLSIYKLLGIETFTANLPYGDTWRMHRKLFHSALRSEAVNKYQSFYMSKAVSLARDLLQDGAASNIEAILQFSTTATTLSFTYGHDIKSPDHPVLELVQRWAKLNGTIRKQAALLQVFPFVKHLPSWLPGFAFLEQVAISRKLVKDVYERPFGFTKNEVAAGDAPQSMVADLLISHQEEKHSEHYQELEAMMMAAAANVYIAGAETSSSALHTFILAMTLFPEVQEKAKAQIDSVVGNDRLPTFDDRDALPYVEAIICETLRWGPIVPLGLPHATTTDDVYEGFHIPKGAMVIFNAWAMSRDCANPEQFNPERHLLPTGELSPTARMAASPVFGFGRRVCPGRFFADSALWAAFVQILATMRFSKAKDENGRPIEIHPIFTSGTSFRPAPFQLSITGTERARLIATS